MYVCRTGSAARAKLFDEFRNVTDSAGSDALGKAIAEKYPTAPRPSRNYFSCAIPT